MLPAPASPHQITEKDFTEHLGDEKYVPYMRFLNVLLIISRYYDAYLAFFTDYLQQNSPTEALERFIFSPAYNFVPDHEATEGDSGKHPQMLNRLLGALLHPFIHVFYGFEFGILGQIAEGIANNSHCPAYHSLTMPIVF